jgi:hypothetical protein
MQKPGKEEFDTGWPRASSIYGGLLAEADNGADE